MKSSKWLVALLAALGFVSLLPSMVWANGISVQVGYADDLRSNAFFPSNFCNGGTPFQRFQRCNVFSGFSPAPSVSSTIPAKPGTSRTFWLLSGARHSTCGIPAGLSR